MLELRNHTPLSVLLSPSLNKDGIDYVTVVMKGRFTIVPGQHRLAIADEPAPVFHKDQYYDTPENSSVRYEADIALRKLATDIVVNGHAYAPKGGTATQVDATVAVGAHSKTCRVFGDRFWEKSKTSVMTWAASPPKAFDRMPLTYERAFGGAESNVPPNRTPELFAANPVGKGFIGQDGSVREGQPLPNIEDPRHLISRGNDRPPPAGFGFIARHWQPRLSFAGTYDEAWQQQRLPLLPNDFNERYFNAAHPDLVMGSLFRGGERVTLTNLSEAGPLAIDLPAWTDPITIVTKGKPTVYLPVMDTVLIEPDDKTVLITWRVSAPCPKEFLYIDSVTIGKKRR